MFCKKGMRFEERPEDITSQISQWKWMDVALCYARIVSCKTHRGFLPMWLQKVVHVYPKTWRIFFQPTWLAWILFRWVVVQPPTIQLFTDELPSLKGTTKDDANWCFEDELYFPFGPCHYMFVFLSANCQFSGGYPYPIISYPPLCWKKQVTFWKTNIYAGFSRYCINFAQKQLNGWVNIALEIIDSIGFKWNFHFQMEVLFIGKVRLAMKYSAVGFNLQFDAQQTFDWKKGYHSRIRVKV